MLNISTSKECKQQWRAVLMLDSQAELDCLHKLSHPERNI